MFVGRKKVVSEVEQNSVIHQVAVSGTDNKSILTDHPLVAPLSVSFPPTIDSRLFTYVGIHLRNKADSVLLQLDILTTVRQV